MSETGKYGQPAPPFSGTRLCLWCGGMAASKAVEKRRGLVDGWGNPWCSDGCAESFFQKHPDLPGCPWCTYVHGLTQDQCRDLVMQGLGP